MARDAAEDAGGGGIYGRPEVYDVLHARGTVREVDGLLRIARRFCGEEGERGRWMEPGCGTGRYLRVLARWGVPCVGVDIGGAMVRYAAARVRPPGRVVRGDMRTITPELVGGEVGVAFCLHNTVRHLGTDEDLAGHLHAVRGVLRDGGAYLVGASLPRGEEVMDEEDVSLARRGGVEVRAVVSSGPAVNGRGEGVERVVNVVTVRRGDGAEEMLTGSYDLWCGGPERWRACVAGAGLREIAAVDEGGRDVGPERTGYAIRVLTTR